MPSVLRDRPFLLSSAAIFIGLLAACKTGGTSSQLSPSTPSMFELHGFDAEGPVTCPPLREGTTCLASVAQKSPLFALCDAKGAQVFYCEDCAVICSVALSNPEAAP